MMKFIKFVLIWVSQQLAIPFWMVGHIHLSLSMDVYSDAKILFASLGMNVIVAVGFWLDWKQYSASKVDHTKRLQEQINENRRLNTHNSNVVRRIIDEIKQMKVYWIEIYNNEDCMPYLKGKRSNTLNNYNTKNDALLDFNELVNDISWKDNSSLASLYETTDNEFDKLIKQA